MGTSNIFIFMDSYVMVMLNSIYSTNFKLSLRGRQSIPVGAFTDRMGGGGNGANRLGCKGFGRVAPICPRYEVVFMPDFEKTCKATEGIRPHKDNLAGAVGGGIRPGN